MFSRRIAAVAAVLIALGGAVSVAKSPALLSQLGFSQSVAQTPSPQPDRGRSGWFKELNLTPDQLKKIQEIRSRYKDQFAQQRQSVQQTQQELRNLMAGNASSNEVRQKYQQLQSQKQRLSTTRFNSMLEIREILTSEQRQKFVNHMKELRMKNKDHFKDHLEK